MKFKYILLSLVLVLSLHSCGGDDDVMPVEQEVTDPTDPGNGGGTPTESVLICSIDNVVEREWIGNSLHLNWQPCASSDNTDVTYLVTRSGFSWNCNIGSYQLSTIESNFIPETSIIYEDLFYDYDNIISVYARDAYANYELIETFTEKISSAGIYEGNLYIDSQLAVDRFEGHQITTLNGDLRIIEYDLCHVDVGEINPSITNLLGLSGIQIITGDLIIDRAVGATSIEAFSSLVEVGGSIRITDSNITSIEGLDAITSIGGNLTIQDCTSLSDFSAFSNLTNLNDVTLINLPNIDEINTFNNVTNNVGDILIESGAQSLNVLNGVTSVDDFTLNCPNLSSITALNNATNVGNLTIEGLSNNAVIDAFNNISNSVENVSINANAQSLNILNNVASVGDFNISGGINELTTLTNTTTVGDFTVAGPSVLTALSSAMSIDNINISSVGTLNGLETITSTNNLELNLINQISSNTLSQLNTIDSLIMGSITQSDLSFINNLEGVTTLIDIRNMPGIQNLNFDSYNSSNPIEIIFRNNSNLQSITGFSTLSGLDELTINGNPQLTNIDFLLSVTDITGSSLRITDNDQLTNLDALSNLTIIDCPGQLIITDNFNLGNLCGLQDFFANNGLCSFEATIENNGYNPTPLQIANGDCVL